MDKQERRKVDGSSVQLRLPFSPKFILDENLPSEPLQTALRESGASVLSLHDLGLLHTSDENITKTAATQEAWIVTRDNTFVLDAQVEGPKPSRVVLVPEARTRSSTDMTELSATVSEKCEQASTYYRSNTILIIDLRGETPSEYSLDLPPERITRLFPLFDKPVRIDSRELTKQWNCTVSTARRIAHQLSQQGWLRIRKKGRINRYYPGPKYLEIKSMLLKKSTD